MEEDARKTQLLENLVSLTETQIILSALHAGISVSRVRELLGVDVNRVTKVSKILRTAKRRSGVS